MPDIHLPVFEGPLDLLLHLIERDDLDIAAVSLVAVTDQYLAAIREGDRFNPSALADFVAIGAKLIYLKSRALLPREPAGAAESLEADAVGRELVDLLLEYRRYLEVVALLEQRQAAGLRGFPRLAPAPPREAGPGLDGLTAERLYAIMLDVLARQPEDGQQPQAVITREGLTLQERMGDLRARLRGRARLSFRALMLECGSRLEVVVCFLAVLELLRSGECDVAQSEAWGDIEVVSVRVIEGVST